MTKQYKEFLLGSILTATLLISCKKNWLDGKPDQKLLVPTTISDLQLLLDNTQIFNELGPVLGEYGSDDYYLANTDYQVRAEMEKNCYMWASGNVFAGADISDWTAGYKRVYNANVVLEGIDKVEATATNQLSWNNVKGSALFYRSQAFLNMAQVFCKPYAQASSSTDLGIILRTFSDINKGSKRSSVQETYDQLISDLLLAKDLLNTTPLYKTRPSKQAVFALLSRAFIFMEDYDNAGKYADSCLKIYNTLIDYNDPTYIGAGTNPFSFSKNPEIIFLGRQGTSNILTGETRKGYVDSVLYKLYANSDKRKTLFFKAISGRLAFTGSYYGPSVQFDGLATDEMYLNRAEAYARKGNKTAALNDLNALLVKRFVPPYTLLTESNTPDILVKVIEERRKELCFRGIRWSDLRRLNKDPQFAKIISHGLLGTNTIFTLPPNDDKYVYPIPDNEVIISSVDQNPR